MEALELSAKNAQDKAMKFRVKPSTFGIKQAKKNTFQNEVHPFFLDENMGEDEAMKNDFMMQLKNFKPKTNIFERVDVEKNEKELKAFKFQVSNDLFTLFRLINM